MTSCTFRGLLLACLVAVAGCSGSSTQDLPFDAWADTSPDGTGDGVDVGGDGECPPGQTLCGEECVDLTSDPLNCGECGSECPGAENADPRCVGGVCGTACHEGYLDLDGDGDCEYACVPTSDTELCNAADDNCNGEVDEGFECIADAIVECTTTCGSTGEGFCSSDCVLPEPEYCTPPVEECNGLDDDCDGEPDNGFDCPAGQLVPCETPCGTTGEGMCHDDCTLPLPGECGIGLEVCNGEDDNCNGSIDEGYPCAAGSTVMCTTTCGSTGTGTCSSTCTLPGPSGCTPPAETCNGRDDDCVGGPDDGFACVMGSSVSCTTTCGTTGTGTCSTSCTLPAPSSCTPPAETCNGADDDCDGTRDNGPGMECVRGSTGLSCTTGGGVSGTQDCTSSCRLGECCSTSEVCGNAWDDDCDTIVDDGCCVTLDECGCAGSASMPGTYTGSNASMSDAYHGGCGSTGGRDVVYELTLTSSTFVHLDTNGSSYDTVLYIFSGSCPGTVVECDDDGGSGLQSMIERTLSAGTYWIVVDAYSSSYTGTYVLNISGGGSSGGETCPGGISYTWPGTATGTTSSYVNDYSSWSCQSWSEGGDVVYTLTLGGSNTVTIDTNGSGFDTVLALLNSSCSEIDCDDDGGSGLQSLITRSMSAGTYYIVVDGYFGASGAYILNVSY